MPESVSVPSRSAFPRALVRAVAGVAVAGVVVTGWATGVTGASAAVRPVSGDASPGPSASPSTGSPVPRPPVPGGLPRELETPSPYVKQVSCDPTAKPGAVALGKLLVATYPGTSYGVARACGADGIASEHYEGRAVDWMVAARDPRGAARASAVIDWLLAPDDAGHAFANARRLGVMYLIWDDRIWGSYASGAGWRPYSTCAAHSEPAWDTSCHRDHIHLSLSWSGATGRTSFWTRKVAPTDYGPCRTADLNWAAPRSAPNTSPCPAYPTVTAPAGAPSALVSLVRYSGAVVGQGSSGPVVRAVQAGLGIAADGSFGPGTAAAVAGFRRSQNLGDGARVDAATWRALVKAAAVPPTAAAGTGANPAPGAKPATATGPAAKPAAKPATARPASGLTAYRGVVLRYGSSGPAVLALQGALKVSPLSGWFGPVTRTAVVAVQRARHLPQTGVVDAATWRALGA